MTTAGSPDSPPGDESEGIHYFDFPEPFEPSETEADPFASEAPEGDTPEGKKRPKLARVRGEREGKEGGAPSHDAFEFALEDLPSRPPRSAAGSTGGSAEGSGATFAPLTAYFGGEEGAAGHRARFLKAFNVARAQAEQPFLAVALRMPVGDPASARFPLVEQGVRSALRSDDALLVDRERLRLVAVLPGRDADAARPLFAHLMAYLREHVENATEVGHFISVFTALNGRPFQSGADFLAEVYDKP